MNKVVREHYPVEKLPEDLRPDNVGAGRATVRVTLEDELDDGPPPLSIDDAIAMMREMQRNATKNGTSVTTEEAVRRIREVRDDWDK